MLERNGDKMVAKINVRLRMSHICLRFYANAVVTVFFFIFNKFPLDASRRGKNHNEVNVSFFVHFETRLDQGKF